jgi:hypothetical protein
LKTGSGETSLAGPQQPARWVTALSRDRLAVVYTHVGQDGRQRLAVGLFQRHGPSADLLSIVEAAGQPAGPALAALRWAAQPPGEGSEQERDERLFLAFRDGQVTTWRIQKEGRGGWALEPAWSRPVGGEGYKLESNAALNGGLLVLAPCRNNRGLLVVLNARNGEVLYEQPLDGDIFLAPLWSQQTLCVLLARGAIEVFRVAVEAR